MQKRDKVMDYDAVHDTQHVYRQLVDAIARPGRICSIETVCGRLSELGERNAGLAACALALLDQEVCFSVVANESSASILREFLRWETFSLSAKTSEADYVFFECGQISAVNVRELMGALKRGTLLDPQKSATAFLTVDVLAETLEKVDEAASLCMRLRGPGIDGTRHIAVIGMDSEWMFAREMVNAEYPLGIDMFLVSEAGQIIGLPRTTIVEIESVEKVV
ncbi:phosphonate C-P lyase system protein PhnH [Alicyclobacillus fastidiosus]|uniref:Phosphonate C-P lyase system protein PhnH n=1 Tax=Alicyclobacillus fastidiosus TaxID=392011 RepID=A0ABY6ZMQ3_9BACL|nr:phosphonate C-P lyase system protein PhnH [Alicyclobacillus fastidiosus]WAH44124.1 phosphonate C-P lyase system protein PhnH [Alicyclobacillus fastidiosus]GMA60425.1 phosphonate C-P lyase system protein PhnH [Alicyclobacillus fastidiosus]